MCVDVCGVGEHGSEHVCVGVSMGVCACVRGREREGERERIHNVEMKMLEAKTGICT